MLMMPQCSCLLQLSLNRMSGMSTSSSCRFREIEMSKMFSSVLYYMLPTPIMSGHYDCHLGSQLLDILILYSQEFTRICQHLSNKLSSKWSEIFKFKLSTDFKYFPPQALFLAQFFSTLKLVNSDKTV